jgi:hypothetical protein
MVVLKPKKASADMPARLEPVLVLGKGSRVMIARNVWQGKGWGDYFHGENITC